jgi:antagonist of KipI
VPVTLVSEPAPIGGIQIPPDGKPIVLMVDRQTIGGYPLAAVVISADIPLLAQVAPGGRVAFRLVTLQEAQHFAAALEKLLITIQFGVMGRQGLQEWRVIVR